MFLHAGISSGPSTLFPPTPDQFEALVGFLLQEHQVSGTYPLPISASVLNGYRYHPDDAISRFNIFRDRYERVEPPTRSTHHTIMSGKNWPEMYFAFLEVDLLEKRAAGEKVDDAELAAEAADYAVIALLAEPWTYTQY